MVATVLFMLLILLGAAVILFFLFFMFLPSLHAQQFNTSDPLFSYEEFTLSDDGETADVSDEGSRSGERLAFCTNGAVRLISADAEENEKNLDSVLTDSRERVCSFREKSINFEGNNQKLFKFWQKCYKMVYGNRIID